MADPTTTILVVDDEDHVRTLLKRILEGAGYDVVIATNGREALDKLSFVKVDLALLDIKMPELDGFQTLALIREKSDIPVMMVTGMGDVTSINDALSIGADDYIIKPFSSGVLLARVEAKLRRRTR